jgi:hypothetical protein
MRYRKLRIAWSVVWGLAFTLLIMLWVRSYWWYDRLAIYSSTQAFGVGSIQGEVVYGANTTTNTTAKPLPWCYYSCEYITTATQFPLQIDGLPYPMTLGFAWYSGEWMQYGFLPHWFLSLTITLLAGIVWVPFKSRFSLRTLLVVTTLVAVVLGLVVLSTR